MDKKKHLTADEVTALIDEPAALPPERIEHLASCADCSERVRRQRYLRQAVASLPHHAPPVDLTAAVMREVDGGVPPVGWVRRMVPQQNRQFYAAAVLTLVIGVEFGMSLTAGQASVPQNKTLRFHHLAIFEPLPLGYPCEERSICEKQEAGL